MNLYIYHDSITMKLLTLFYLIDIKGTFLVKSGTQYGCLVFF